MTRAWTWRVADGDASAHMRLRYEPGSWGDLLKGLCTFDLARALLAAGAHPLHYADPFAGAPSYPRVAAAAARLEQLGGHPSASAHPPGEILGTAGLVLSLGAVRARVYDRDATRRALWATRSGVRILDVGDGWEALDADLLSGADLVLVDPYDLDQPAHWQSALPDLQALRAGGAHLVLYLFNRAPQGAPRFAAYRRFRDALGPVDLAARLPADAVLPRAFHEVLVLLSPAARVPVRAQALDAIASEVRSLAAALAMVGAVERDTG